MNVCPETNDALNNLDPTEESFVMRYLRGDRKPFRGGEEVFFENIEKAARSTYGKNQILTDLLLELIQIKRSHGESEDTQCAVSALISGEISAEVFNLWDKGAITWLFIEHLMDEKAEQCIDEESIPMIEIQDISQLMPQFES